jgi:hypothetical protein
MAVQARSRVQEHGGNGPSDPQLSYLPRQEQRELQTLMLQVPVWGGPYPINALNKSDCPFCATRRFPEMDSEKQKREGAYSVGLYEGKNPSPYLSHSVRGRQGIEVRLEIQAELGWARPKFEKFEMRMRRRPMDRTKECCEAPIRALGSDCMTGGPQVGLLSGAGTARCD